MSLTPAPNAKYKIETIETTTVPMASNLLAMASKAKGKQTIQITGNKKIVSAPHIVDTFLLYGTILVAVDLQSASAPLSCV